MSHRDEPLSPRELQILRGLAAGDSGAEIGRRLHIAEPTVKTHSTALYAKLGARNRCHAVAIGYEQGLLTTGDSGGRRG